MADSLRFPPGFLWGAATSAYQIEGAPLDDGAGDNIWHRFCRVPGAVRGGDTGDIACDHYRRYAEDVSLMRGLGLEAYRFSLAWARLLPAGRGARNRAGIDFYSRLVDRLLEAGIRPFVTLYHWDLPAALDDRGGWLNPDSPRWFADFAELAFRTFGDRVSLWATLNEPFMVSDGGYLQGFHAPGHHDAGEAAAVSHHLLCAHGEAVRVFRGSVRGEIGLVVNLEPKLPATSAPRDLAAAERADTYMNRQYLDPVLKGEYPPELKALWGAAWQDRFDLERHLIHQPVDFVGVNYYSQSFVREDPTSLPTRASRVRDDGAPRTAMGWEIHPEGLGATLRGIRDRYGDVPLYVTENGAAFEDPDPSDGVVEDPDRVDYLRQHLLAARRAMDQGVNLRGYFAWSLLDNFEWQYGYSKRFGLVHVDFATQRRTPKRSALFYRDVIRSRGEALGG